VESCQWKPETVHHTFRTIAQSKPAYSALLPFFESVFSFQEAAAATAQPMPIQIEDHILAAKRKGGLPLMERSHMPVDWSATFKLLGVICEAAGQANPVLAEAAGSLSKHLDLGGAGLEESFLSLLADDSLRLSQSAAQLGVGAGMLPFFLYNSLWPSIAAHARRLGEKLQDHEAATDGYCPLCGGTPFISLLGEQGQRVLVCSFCRHTWPVIRIFCPFCGSTDSSAISYFFSEEEKEYRVHTCQNCLKYIKTIDTRQLQRACYPPLEAIVSAHLDIKAQSLGFTSPVPPWWVL
jgi:FdhE protein